MTYIKTNVNSAEKLVFTIITLTQIYFNNFINITQNFKWELKNTIKYNIISCISQKRITSEKDISN